MSDSNQGAHDARLKAIREAAANPPPIIASLPSPPVRSPPLAAPPLLPIAQRVRSPAQHLFRGQPKAIRRSLLTPRELERFGNLLLFARSTVEGYFAGKHKSRAHGSSVEFTDYREYVAGDEPRKIDWRAYGRSRRLFVRQYEAETDMVIYLLVDVSASMNYASKGCESKYVLAARIAAALSYLMIHQGDKAALALFADRVRRFLPPGGTKTHLNNLVNELDRAEPGSTTGIAAALQECSQVFRKRGRLVILSDFWDELDPTLEELSRFVHRKFDVLLLQIVNRDELNLPSVHAARFRDLETDEEVEVEPEEIRAAYRLCAREWVDRLAREANNRRVSHALVRSDRPYLDAIEAYLGFRGRSTLSAR